MKNYFYIVFLFVLFSCKKEHNPISKTFKLNNFTHLITENSFEVYLTEDTFNQVSIVADPDFIDYIEYSIENDTLRFRNKRNQKWLTPTRNKVKIYITSKPIQYIQLADGCYLESLTPMTNDWFGMVLYGKANDVNLELNCKNFYYWNMFPCGGIVKLRGKTGSFNIWNFGLMRVDAKNLTVPKALVENNAKGNCSITVTDSLKYKITGKGDIEVYGNPISIINEGENSTGKLIKK